MKKTILILSMAILFLAPVFSQEVTIKTVTDSLISDANSDEEKLERIFYFVRDEILFDFVYPQDLPAEQVLKNGRGVCMQKANLMNAMLIEAGFKTRFHFMYVDKRALEDFLPAFAYKRWMSPFPHTFVEVLYKDKWISLEATIDKELHRICVDREINFGKYPALRNISTEFSIEGVKGEQQYVQIDSIKSEYGQSLEPLIKFTKTQVSWVKQKLQPVIFKKSSKIIENLRKENNSKTLG